MGWEWKYDIDIGYYLASSGDVDGEFYDSSNPNGNGDGDRCPTRKLVRSQYRTEEVEPGKYIRQCEKNDQTFKDCVGRAREMVKSCTEHTSEDVTDQMAKGLAPLDSSNQRQYFYGLHGDLKALNWDFFRGALSQLFEEAEEIKNEFFNSHKKHGLHIADTPAQEVPPKSDGRF